MATTTSLAYREPATKWDYFPGPGKVAKALGKVMEQ
jgi:hypothetical protein